MNSILILKKLQQKLIDLDKEKNNRITIAQLNAMQGQNNNVQCFFQSLDDEENALVNDPNAKTKDLGGLGE